MAYCSRYFTEFHLLKQLWTVIGWHEHCHSLNQINDSLWDWDQNCMGKNYWCSCLIWPCPYMIMYFPSQSDIFCGVHSMFNFRCTKTKVGRLNLHILGYNNLKKWMKLNTKFLCKWNKRGGPIGPDTLYNICRVKTIQSIQ